MPKQFNRPACKAQIKYITSSYKQYDVIILAGYWEAYIPVFQDYLKSTLDELKSNNKNIIVMEDVPSYLYKRHSLLPLFVHNYLIKSMQASASYSPKELRSITMQYSNVYYFDIEKEIINNIPTYPFYNNTFLYVDSTHLSSFGSLFLAQQYLLKTEQQQSLKQALIKWKTVKEK